MLNNLNAPNLLKIIFIMYEKNGSENLEDSLLDIMNLSIVTAVHQNAALSQFCAISWLIEVSWSIYRL